jgi:O-methyltransferase involved in polyketide biosynthesis
MTQVEVALPDAMETSLIMLYGLALDARADPTILGDEIAAQAFDRVAYDFTRLDTPLVSARSMSLKVAARAKFFDDWTRDFLAAHDQATVLNLGAGLDPRVWRIDPGPGVRWYDVDLPGVVEARRRLFPERADYQLVASSVTDPEWLEEVPADRPVLVIAQGLTMYLRPADGHALFRRIVDRFPSGTVVLDTHSKLGVRAANSMLTRQFGAPLLHWAIDDPHELERADPRLRCTDVVSAVSPAIVDGLPPGAAPRGSRFLGRIAERIPPLRDMSLHLRYAFPSGTPSAL